jgi:hypothetical protein
MRGPTRAATGVSNTKDSFCTNKTRQRTTGPKYTGTARRSKKQTKTKWKNIPVVIPRTGRVSTKENANVFKIHKRNVFARQREVSTSEDSSCGLASAIKSSSPWPAVNSIKLNNSHQSLDVYYYGEDEKIEHACWLYLESVKRRMDQGMTLLDLSHLGESRDDSVLHSISNEDDLNVVEHAEVSSDSDFSDDRNDCKDYTSWTDVKEKSSGTIIEPAHTLKDSFLFTTDHHGFAQDPLVVIENSTSDDDSTSSCSSSSSDFSSGSSLNLSLEFPHDQKEEATDSTHRPTTLPFMRIDSAYTIELELD